MSPRLKFVGTGTKFEKHRGLSDRNWISYIIIHENELSYKKMEKVRDKVNYFMRSKVLGVIALPKSLLHDTVLFEKLHWLNCYHRCWDG